MPAKILIRILKLFERRTASTPNNQNVDLGDCCTTIPMVVRKNVSGRCYLAIRGDMPCKIMAVNCLKKSAKITVSIDSERFAELMRGEGASDATITEYLNSVSIIDEICVDDSI